MEIRVELGNWQFNAGIVGLYSVLKNHDENSVRMDSEALYFNSEELENFEEKYFNYLIKVYEKTLSWYKIVSFKDKLDYFKNKEVDEKDLNEINTYVKDVLKKYLKSNSYVAAYDFISGDINPTEAEKKLKTINLKKKEKIEDKNKEIKELLDQIEKIIEYCSSLTAKRYICGKNLIYNIIKNGWDGVSFLYRQTKEKDIYKDFKNYFISPINEYLESDKKKYKYNCFICNREIKNLDNDFSFLVNTGFDTNRKLSHVWDFTNDVAMCPICKLVYSCVPVGFSYVFGTGIFINANTNIKNLINVNTRIKTDIYKEENLSGIYKVLNRELQKDMEYELEDIQLVRFENEKYYFNILSKNMIRVIIESIDDLKKIESTTYKINGETYSLNDELNKKLLNNENLFNLIHKLLYSKVSGDSNYLSAGAIFSTIKINFRMLKGIGYMENRELDILSKARLAGRDLKEKYESKGSEHKLQGICYRILNGIKTNNITMVMDTILNSYLYCDESVPKIIMEMMGDEEGFKELGYSFVTGLLSKKFDDKKDENKNSEDKGGEE